MLFLGDDVHLTEPTECYDLSDDLIDIEDEDGNTAWLNSLEDAQIAGGKTPWMTRLPIAVHTHDPEVPGARAIQTPGGLRLPAERKSRGHRPALLGDHLLKTRVCAPSAEPAPHDERRVWIESIRAL